MEQKVEVIIKKLTRKANQVETDLESDLASYGFTLNDYYLKPETIPVSVVEDCMPLIDLHKELLMIIVSYEESGSTNLIFLADFAS